MTDLNKIQGEIQNIAGSFWQHVVEDKEFLPALSSGITNAYSAIDERIAYYQNAVNINDFDYKLCGILYPLFLGSAEDVPGWLDRPPFETLDKLVIDGNTYAPARLDTGSPVVKYSRYALPQKVLTASFLTPSVTQDLEFYLEGRDFFIENGYIYIPDNFEFRYEEKTKDGVIKLAWLVGVEHLGIGVAKRFSVLGNLSGLQDNRYSLQACKDLLELRVKGLSKSRLEQSIKSIYGTSRVSIRNDRIPESYTFNPVFNGKIYPQVTMYRGSKDIYYMGDTLKGNPKLEWDIECSDRAAYWNSVYQRIDDGAKDLMLDYVDTELINSNVPRQRLLNLDPKAWFEFNKDPNDSSNYGNTITVDSGEIDYENGKLNEAAVIHDFSRFEISGTGVEQIFDSSAELTMSCWMKFNSLATKFEHDDVTYSGRLPNLRIDFDSPETATNGSDINLVFNPNRLNDYNRIDYMQFGETGRFLYPNNLNTDAVLYKLNEWFHLCVVYSRGKFSLYINGEAVVGRSISGAPNFDKLELIKFVGSYYSIDELMLFNKALSETEIKKLTDYKLEPGTTVGYEDPLEILFNKYLKKNNLFIEVDVKDIPEEAYDNIRFLMPVLNQSLDTRLELNNKINYYTKQTILTDNTYSTDYRLSDIMEINTSAYLEIRDNSYFKKVWKADD